MGKFKAIVILAAGVIPVLLGLIVLMGNLGNDWTLHVISKDFTASRSVMCIFVAFFSWVIVRLGIAFIPKGITSIKAAWAKKSEIQPAGEPNSDSDSQ